MRTLQRALASGVLEALRARAHVQVAPQCSDALRDEVEAIIAPELGSIRSQLSDGDALGNGDAHAAMRSIVDRITEQLLASDHLDDIFADDRIIRRDAFRAIRDILLGYIRGEVDVDEEADTGAFDVRFDGLGYLVAHASRALDEPSLTDALERAATNTGASLLDYDPVRHTATFLRAGGAEAGRLALEEHITEELSELARAGAISLPAVEQVLEVEDGSSAQRGFEAALERAAARIERATKCNARCEILDAHTLLARLTPLSDDAAERASEHFARFVELLEEELQGEHQGDPPPPPARTSKRTNKRTAAPRNRRKKAPASAEPVPSRTRARNDKPTRRRTAK
jgi:hypothetical protein